MPNITIKTQDDLRLILAKQYKQQVMNYFRDEKQAMKFLSGVMGAVQRTPKLLECEAATLINAFMTMAQLELMPSGVSGEAYVIPYKNSGKMEAQFQLGYQGLITLFYRSGGARVRAEIVREHDTFSYENGEIRHSVDIRKSREDRGEAIAAYAIATVNGQDIALAMNKNDIIGYGERFSKSFKSEYSPWNEKNDPELWMWKKTVLKQLGKLLPKNETVNRAIAEDNKESVMHDRIEAARNESDALRMGALVTPADEPVPAEKTPQEPKKDISEVQPRTAAGKAVKHAMEQAKGGAELPEKPACTSCHEPVSDKEVEYSQKHRGVVMCYKCQKAN